MKHRGADMAIARKSLSMPVDIVLYLYRFPCILMLFHFRPFSVSMQRYHFVVGILSMRMI